MSTAGILLILFVLGLLGVLALAGGPPRRRSLSVEETLEVFSRPSHTSHLFPVLRALRADDAEYLVTLKQPRLAEKLKKQRRQIGLLYLQALENEFGSLLGASKTLAVMSPQLKPMEELERLKLGMRFALLSRYMRISLRFGVSPHSGFNMLSAMSVRIAIALDGATSASVQRAVVGYE